MEVKNFPQILIMLLISVLFAVALIPTLVTQWTGVDLSGWDFTGYAGAKLLWGLVPFIIIAGMVLAFVLMFITRRKGA